MFGHDNQNNRDEEVVKADDAKKDDTTISPTDNTEDTSASKHDDADENEGLSSFEATPAAAHVKPVVPNLPEPDAPALHHGKAVSDDLLAIKQEALQALTPLVGQLDQTPEEQFRTTMMMIQASDDHALVKVAYEAAKKISNEKERAQALLDIVNEINYFTQNATQA